MTDLTFRWKYVLLPVAILFLTIILATSFYSFLPDNVAYRFNLDGLPKAWLGHELVTVLMLAPQFLLALAALGITLGATKLGHSGGHIKSSVRVERILLLMGNMAALPQLVLSFVMMDIFSYNIYGIHLLPLWLFALIVMVLGGVILAVFFIRAAKPSSGFSGESSQ
jgi:uncharacterized membrane protein